MGQVQDTLNRGESASTDRRLRPRVCLRKGCEQTYQPVRWNQRYCQDLDCLRALRRWQAAKRQREHRRIPKNRQRHALAESARRQRRREAPEAERQVGTLHPKETSPDRCAWSRSKKYSQNLCARPGCYEPPRVSHRAPSRYCGDACRQAVRRVRDRERKWLRRNGCATFHKRGIRQEADTQGSRLMSHHPRTSHQDGGSFSVGDYRAASQDRLSCHSHQPRENDHDNDRKTHPCLRPRSPPTP